MKKLLVITVIAVCLALCATVWPQATTNEEVPAAPPSPAVTATQPDIPELSAIEESMLPAEDMYETGNKIGSGG